VSDKQSRSPELKDIPSACPVTGGRLVITELESEDGSVTIRGRFRLPPAALLDAEQGKILEVFLRSRGVIATMERELGLSYPTVRSRIDGLLESMGLKPYRSPGRSPKIAAARKSVLDQLEQGEITADEAKRRLKMNNGVQE
jgi:hypothetical protein